MGIKKRLLPFTRVYPDKMLAGIFGAHAEKLQFLHPAAGNNCGGCTPVNLCLESGFRIAGNKGARTIYAQNGFGAPDIPTNSGLSSCITMFATSRL